MKKEGKGLSRVMQDRIAGTVQNEKGISSDQGPKGRAGYDVKGRNNKK